MLLPLLLLMRAAAVSCSSQEVGQCAPARIRLYACGCVWYLYAAGAGMHWSKSATTHAYLTEGNQPPHAAHPISGGLCAAAQTPLCQCEAQQQQQEGWEAYRAGPSRSLQSFSGLQLPCEQSLAGGALW